MKEVISIWTHDWNFLERPGRSIDTSYSAAFFLASLEANNSNTENCHSSLIFTY